MDEVFEKLISRFTRFLVLETTSWSPHIEAGAEIAIRLAESGASVRYFHIGHLLNSSEGIESPRIGLRRLWKTRETKAEIIFSILKDVAIQQNLDLIPFLPQNERKHGELTILANEILRSQDSVKDLDFNGCNIGVGIFSSLIEQTRDSDPPLQTFRDQAIKLTADALTVLQLLEEYSERENFDCVVLFNGRFASSGAGYSWCKMHNKQVLFHELGGRNDFFYFSPQSPHDLQGLSQNILALWKDAVAGNASASSRIALNRLEAQSKDIKVNRFLVPAKKVGSNEPKNQRTAAQDTIRNVTFFTSSDDELASTYFFQNPREWSSQAEAISAAADICQRREIPFTLRIHPNILNKSLSEIDRWWEVAQKVREMGGTVVEAGDGTSSYDLLQGAEIVITYGSTIGAEAISRGIISITMSDTYWWFDGVTAFNVHSIRELESCLTNSKKFIVDPDSVLPFWFWLCQSGIPFKYFEPVNSAGGLMFNRPTTNDRPFVRAIRRFRGDKT